MKLWLNGHGYVPEPVQPGSQRTFDMGHIIEAAMFRGVKVATGDIVADIPEFQHLGPWWPDLGEVKDHSTGQSFLASEATVTDFQRTVQFAGYRGHIDGILKINPGRYVIDCKSTQGYGFKRHLTDNLSEDPFAKAYIAQLHFYIAGLKAEGEKIDGGILLFVSKENSQVMCRFVPYDASMVEEVKERLSWATNAAEPEPDWAWDIGKPLPLVSSYCDQKQNCAKIRGLVLEFGTEKGKPVWIPRSL